MRGAREEKPRRIGQGEVERLLVLREQAREARATAAKKEQELQAEEARLMALLCGGGEVEPGPYFALVITEPTARSVAWRQVVEQHLGKAFATEVLAATAPGERQVLKVLQEVKVEGQLPVAGGAPGRGLGEDGRGMTRRGKIGSLFLDVDRGEQATGAEAGGSRRRARRRDRSSGRTGARAPPGCPADGAPIRHAMPIPHEGGEK